MDFARTALTTTLLLMAIPPVTAQPVLAPPAPAPSTWTVSTDEIAGAVEIAATAKNGAAHFAGGCSKSSEPGLVGAFSRYQGSALKTDGEVQRVALYVQGAEWQELFSASLRYSAANGTWELAKPLAPVFLSSFSRGGTLAVVVRNEEAFAFDLTGSAVATKTMRSVCGME